MQITVSRAMAKRIEDSSSRSARGREPGVEGAGDSRVVAVIDAELKKTGGPSWEAPAFLGCPARSLVQPLLDLAQAGNVICHGPDLPIVELGGDLGHLRAVLADSVTEGDQLAGRVVGMLAGQAGVLGRDAGAVGAVAA